MMYFFYIPRIFFRTKNDISRIFLEHDCIFRALSLARWHDKYTNLSSLGILGTTQLNFFEDHIIFNNGYMKHASTRQRMTNNNNNDKRNQV